MSEMLRNKLFGVTVREMAGRLNVSEKLIGYAEK